MDDMRFDRWLETELDRELTSYTRLTACPTASRYHALDERRGPRMLVKSLLAATGTKLLVGGAAVAMAATAVTGAAITGSPNPSAWGQQVQSAVEGCKASLGTGVHGIGDCVSDFAQKHVDNDTTPKVEGKSDQSHGKGAEGKSDQPHGKGAKSDPPASGGTAQSTGDPTPSTTPDPAPKTEGNSDSSQGRGNEGNSDNNSHGNAGTAQGTEGNSDSSQGRGTEGHSDPTPASSPAADPTAPAHPTPPAHPVHPTHP